MLLKKLCSINRRLVFDAEANDLLHKVTKMYCVVAEDYDTGERFLFHDYPEFDNFEGVDEEGKPFKLPPRDGTLKEGVQFIHKAKQLICHNCIGYDFFLMQKFYPKFKIRYAYPEVRDTLLESQVSLYDRGAVKGHKGIHGLDPWAARLGSRKPPIKDWSFMDASKLHRCLEDVEINTRVAKKMEQEFAEHLEERGADLTKAMQWEQEYRYWSTIQEINGALVDSPHMKRCILELDKLIEELRAGIEPRLPPSIKVKAVKEEICVVAAMLGVTKHIEPEYTYTVVDGEDVRKPVKRMFKPTIKFQNVKKQKIYGVMLNNEIKKDCTFYKLKEAREWAKENYPDVKKGIKYPSKTIELYTLDKHTTDHFADTIKDDGAEILGPFTKIEFRPSTMSQHDKVKLMLVSIGWQTDEWTWKQYPKNTEVFKWGKLRDVSGTDMRAEADGIVKWPKKPINGYQLTETYKKGERIPMTPKVTKDSIKYMMGDDDEDGIGQQIKRYNTYVHRRGFIENPKDNTKGLLNNIREDGRISCGIMTFGTTAGRAAQYGWVNAPGVQALYGENIRKIIVASPGHKLIGIDMPSAHPRLLADFTQNKKFIESVDGKEEEEDGTYVGEDFHTVNSVLFELNDEGDVELARANQDHDLIKLLSKGRKVGKGGSYCTIYGGSDKKLALTIGIDMEKGARIKDKFLAGLGLDKLLEKISETWDEYKFGRGSYIKVLGKYIIWCSSKHKIINYKALGSEAVVQKVAVVLICREMRKRGLKTRLILNVHDEILLEVPDDEIDVMKILGRDLYVEAAKELGLTLDWTSVAKVGESYAACH